ncbi:hypothetical protein SSYM_2358, partial [Serratia symbiotica str. Tucson]
MLVMNASIFFAATCSELTVYSR